MPIKQATPYLYFDGTAEHALKHYEQALGAEIVSLQRYSEMPADAGTCVPADRERILHADVKLGAASIMVSDRTSDRGESNARQVQIALELDDLEDMAQKFTALAEGGEVNVPIHDTFWGAKFGALTDPFGVQWAFNCMKT
ncbi:hypothetical protein ENSA5_21370 [Enhygromyxa salina]|uniref:Glyoxalase/fosfomycin resistance/dioxygenase domain-containing protein n=1 Tax=Enhygromyxa salina TaxID=215803 RepID=A0A2S9YCE4_9BACT|nr:glyoxalase/bleomycin resistance/extradiol dioxygenase family protein [Enhygromyxa salina]PRQ02784.1 hypothetical protein ENSA5_21370 [Enhygromyxa salina]